MEKLIEITDGEIHLEGMLKIPDDPRGIVLFAHGSGSSRLSPRNNFVANILFESNFTTLLIDLLSEGEDETYETRFNINLLSQRLAHVVKWLKKETKTQKLPLGLFGASTGAAAALEVAASMPTDIDAVISRGGRPDLVMSNLHKVMAPTLLIVGGNDFGVIELNQAAFDRLTCHKKMEIIPNATHLFEEPGCLQEVAHLATKWFQSYLTK